MERDVSQRPDLLDTEAFARRLHRCMIAALADASMLQLRLPMLSGR